MADETAFQHGLFQHLNCTEVQFESYKDGVKTYRDKFVAHLDNQNTAQIPSLNHAKDSTHYLFNYLINNEQIDNCFHDAPAIENYYNESFAEAERVYQSAE